MDSDELERIRLLLEFEAEKSEKAMKSSEKQLLKLEQRFDPLARATQKLTKDEKLLAQQLERGNISAQKHASLLKSVRGEYKATEALVLSMNKALGSGAVQSSGFSSILNKNRFIVQQFGYQVGDAAVQIQGGTSALTALTQQGSQMLGAFGPMGAVMGAVLAVGAPLAGVLWNMGEATESTKEKAKTFTDRLDEANSALAAMGQSADLASVGGLENLRKTYGALTKEVREMASALFEIDKREAVGKVSQIINEVTSEVAKSVNASAGIASSALAGVGTSANLEEAAETLKEIERTEADINQRKRAGFQVSQAELNILAERKEELAALEGNMEGIGSLISDIGLDPLLLSQIAEAQAGLEAASLAGDFSGVADQLARVRDLLVEAGEVVSQDLIDSVTQTEATTRELGARMQEANDAADGIASADMAGNLASAAINAAELRDILNEAAASSEAISGIDKSNPDFFDPRGEGAAGVFDPSGRGSGPELKAPKAKTGGGRSRRRGGSKRKVPDLFVIASGELENLQRQIDMLGKSKGEVAALTVKYKLLDEAKKRGIALTDELNAKIEAEAESVGQLADQYEQARDKVTAMEQVQAQFKDSVIDAAMGGKDAMEQFTQSIKRAGIEYALFGTGLFSGGKKTSGGFGGLLGGVFGGLLSFDGGGRTGSGPRSGGMDGKGGFPAILHPNETVIDHTKNGGPGSLAGDTFYISVNGARGNQEITEMVQAGIEQARPGIVSQSVQQTGRAMQATRTFGN